LISLILPHDYVIFSVYNIYFKEWNWRCPGELIILIQRVINANKIPNEKNEINSTGIVPSEINRNRIRGRNTV
jgi:hypothetical protein